jgi:4-amino-4-deoxy-L-arabinose transferase-like glycosyltransferase
MKLPARLMEAFLLLCLLAVVFLLATSLRTEFFPQRDSRENLLIAFNLHRYKVYSVRETADGIPPGPTTKREPLYPVLLSFWMAAVGGRENPAERSALKSLTPEFVRDLKILNVLLHLLLVLASWWAARTFFGRPWPALAVAALIGFNSSMLSHIDVFLTEIPAAALLATSSAVAYLSFTRKSAVYPLLGGLSFGALALTKAVFFYFLVLQLAGAAVWLAVTSIRKQKPGRPFAVRWAALALVALAVYSPWFLRNQRLGETMQMDERGEDVLAVRAEYSTMSWRQYAASFLFFTPEIGPRLTAALFGEQTARSFDRSKPESFFRKALNGTGEVQKTAVARNISPRQAAVRVMAEHLPMMGLLTLPFAYRGAFLEVGFNVRRVPRVILYSTMAYSLFFVPALIYLAIALVRQKDRRWPYLVPALYSYFFHSLVTHYIPRYSIPLIPIFIIALLSAIVALAGKRLKHEAHRTDSVSE